MRRSLLALFLLATAAPLFANDEGGDVAYIPSYQELVREGYGPRENARETYDRRLYSVRQAAPKPTQAYYGKGYTIYYAYTAVPTFTRNPNLLYAFGYSLDYFNNKMPASAGETNLDHYAVYVPKQGAAYGPGDFVAKAEASQATTVTTVQSVKANPATANTVTTNTANTTNGANALPAIGEKPPR